MPGQAGRFGTRWRKWNCWNRRFGIATERQAGETGGLVPRERETLAKSGGLVPIRGEIRGLVPALGRISRFGTRKSVMRFSRPGVSSGCGNQIAEVGRNRGTKPPNLAMISEEICRRVPNRQSWHCVCEVSDVFHRFLALKGAHAQVGEGEGDGGAGEDGHDEVQVGIVGAGEGADSVHSGSRTSKTLPRFGTLCTSIVPPCSSTMRLQRAKPSPDPAAAWEESPW